MPLRRLLPLLLVAAALGLFIAFGGADAFRLEALTARHAELTGLVAENRLTAALVFVAVYAALVAISFPGASAMTLIGGLLFGTWLGGALVVIAATIGAALIFLVARTALGDSLRRKAGPFLQRLQAGFDANAFSYLLTLRLIPAVPFWVLNIAAGVFGMRLAPYVAATALGIIPATFIFASVGAGAGSIVAGGGRIDTAGLLLQPQVLLPIAGLVMLSLLPVIVQRLRGRPLAPPER